MVRPPGLAIESNRDENLRLRVLICARSVSERALIPTVWQACWCALSKLFCKRPITGCFVTLVSQDALAG